MKNRFFKLAAGATVLLLSVNSCKKDETQVVLNNSASPQLTASATTATITPATGASPAVTYSWTKAEYGYSAAVTYTLQFAKAGTNFASTADYNMGNSLSKSFSVKELNDVYNALDCNLPAQPAPPAAPLMVALDVRVKANVGDAVPTAMSVVKPITANPYPDFVAPSHTWGLVGPAADGWPGATNTDRTLTYDCRTRSYNIRTVLNPGAFLLRMDQAWATKLTGTGDFSKGITLATSGADMVWTGPAGTYNMKLEVNYNAAGGVVDGKLTITP